MGGGHWLSEDAGDTGLRQRVDALGEVARGPDEGYAASEGIGYRGCGFGSLAGKYKPAGTGPVPAPKPAAMAVQQLAYPSPRCMPPSISTRSGRGGVAPSSSSLTRRPKRRRSTSFIMP